MTHRIHYLFATISALITLTSKACHAFTFAPKRCTFPRRCTTFQSAMTQHEIVTSCRPFGGDVYRIVDDDHGDEMIEGCPIFAVAPSSQDSTGMIIPDKEPTRLGLEALVPGSFVLRDAVSVQDCEAIIRSCENDIKFAKSQDSKSVVHIMASDGAVDQLSRIVCKHINLDVLFDLPSSTVAENGEDDDIRYTITGINKHWKIHRYNPTLDAEMVAPSLNVGHQATKLSDDGSGIIWNATPEGRDILSRFTVILFLNDDFTGGHEIFFVPASEQEGQMTQLLASIKPKVGSILVYPQSTNDKETIAYAKQHWPLYASLSSTGGTRPKYVLRTDILVDTSRNLAAEDVGSPLFQYDALVRDAFLPRSPIVDQKMASHLASLYNPHMGVENAGPLLYSLVRFAKPRRIVEIGAGYTSLWLLQALKDNDMEMERIFKLQKQGKCRLLDYPWSVEDSVSEYMRTGSSLLCIDNCLHQRETATGAAAVAANLGLADYFEFIQGDAYDMDFDIESIDLLWCDFGVGSRMRDFARGAWRSIRPGGFLVCHSTLTNKGTRDWLEDVRARREESLTGIPPDEVVELSLLEPTKRYQNSVTILQRRKSQSGEPYEEPLYSLYA
eukprot:scaffold429_cov169-Amphora_coffeaeformis.AAC.11